MQHLRRLGYRRVMVEGGGATITSFLDSGMVDSVVLTVAPCLVGGE
jgi:riboflavin biosynthesis pyrimidine reductase